MRRWAIVEKNTLNILGDYRFKNSQLGTGAFGGRWNDPDVVMHIVVASEFDSISISGLTCVFEEMGTLRDDEGELIFDFIKQDLVDAFDADGQPVLQSNGTQAKVLKHVATPRLGPIHFITEK